MRNENENEKLIKAYVNGYRECVSNLIKIGIHIPEIEATADYLPKLIEMNPKQYKIL